MTTPHDAPRGTTGTALDALLTSPELAYARTALRRWQSYRVNDDPAGRTAFPDAVDALATALQAIDLLLAANDELGTELTQANIDYMQVTNGGRDLSGYDEYAPPVGACFTVYHTNSEDRPDSHVFEVHRANPNGTPQCGTRYPLQPYDPSREYEPCLRCYAADAQPTPPAVALAYPTTRSLLVKIDAMDGEHKTHIEIPANLNTYEAVEQAIVTEAEKLVGSAFISIWTYYDINDPSWEPQNKSADPLPVAVAAQPEAERTGAKLSKAQRRELDDLSVLGELTYNRKILPATFKLMENLYSRGLVELVASTENTATYKLNDAGRAALDGATTPDAFWDQPLLDDAAQPEAARSGAKLTARNNHILRNVKRMYNAHIYKEFSRHANDESLDVALDWLLKAYVAYDRRGEVRANLEADNA